MKHLISILLLLSPLYSIAQIKVYDINKSARNSSYSDPNYLTVYENKLYLRAYDSAHGNELWVVDPASGESLVADINPSNGISSQQSGCPMYGFHMTIAFVEALQKEALFYIYNDGVHGNELFRYHGVNPPVLIKEYLVGSYGLASACATDLITIKDTIFLYDQSTGIWKYNVNTHHARKIANSDYPVKQLPNRLFEFKGELYINAEDSTNTNRLYVYNRNANTMDLKFDLKNFNHSRVINNVLYFVAGDSLYKYDGTNMPEAIAPAAVSPVNTYTQNHIGEFSGKVYYQASNTDLYEYDPALKTTRLIAKSTQSGPYQPDGFIECDGKMYFSASDQVHGRELWVWDGVNDPKLAVDIIQAGTNNSSSPFDFRVIDNKLYFIAYSGINGASGMEVHRYDPNATSVKNISFSGEVNIYPNPATDNATLEITLAEQRLFMVSLYSINGKKIYSIPNTVYSAGTTKVSLNTNTLPSGTYFYSVIDNKRGQLAGGKLMIQ